MSITAFPGRYPGLTRARGYSVNASTDRPNHVRVHCDSIDDAEAHTRTLHGAGILTLEHAGRHFTARLSHDRHGRYAAEAEQYVAALLDRTPPPREVTA